MAGNLLANKQLIPFSHSPTCLGDDTTIKKELDLATSIMEFGFTVIYNFRDSPAYETAESQDHHALSTPQILPPGGKQAGRHRAASPCRGWPGNGSPNFGHRQFTTSRFHPAGRWRADDMLVVAGAVLGALLGYRSAGRRDGDRLDRLQFAAVYGLAFGLAGLVLTLLAGWLGIGYA